MNLFDVYPLYEIEPVRGRGSYVYDLKGIEYLDFYGGHAVISVGHSHPHYVQRLTKQLQKLGFYSNSIINSLQKELATKLGKMSGCDQYQLFLVNSGAEANENAIKLASFQNGRKKVLSFKKSFHGRTSAACNVTDDPKIKSEINKTFEVTFCELNDIESSVAAIMTEEYTCVIGVTIQGHTEICTMGQNSITKCARRCCTKSIINIQTVGLRSNGDYICAELMKYIRSRVISRTMIAIENDFQATKIMIIWKRAFAKLDVASARIINPLHLAEISRGYADHRFIDSLFDRTLNIIRQLSTLCREELNAIIVIRVMGSGDHYARL